MAYTSSDFIDWFREDAPWHLAAIVVSGALLSGALIVWPRSRRGSLFIATVAVAAGVSTTWLLVGKFKSEQLTFRIGTFQPLFSSETGRVIVFGNEGADDVALKEIRVNGTHRVTKRANGESVADAVEIEFPLRIKSGEEVMLLVYTPPPDIPIRQAQRLFDDLESSLRSVMPFEAKATERPPRKTELDPRSPKIVESVEVKTRQGVFRYLDLRDGKGATTQHADAN